MAGGPPTRDPARVSCLPRVHLASTPPPMSVYLGILTRLQGGRPLARQLRFQGTQGARTVPYHPPFVTAC